MQEIGGYFELENISKKYYYTDLLEFNSARNCLLFLIKKRKIGKIYLPYLICDVLIEICKKNNIQVEFYNININFLPLLSEKKINNNTYLYVVNYYGLLSNSILLKLKKKYKYIIIDNTHSFFQKPLKNIDIIYSCRKYFGVPDGAYLSTNLKVDKNLFSIGKSINRIEYLIGRYETNASKYYEKYKKSEELLVNEDIKFMSKFTKNIMGAIDYNKVKKVRYDNINYLHNSLKKLNSTKIFNKNCNFMYPFYCENSERLRRILINNRIYIPILWPNVLESCKEDSLEYKFVSNILPIPCDQRYSKKDMDIVINIIKKFYQEGENNEEN